MTNKHTHHLNQRDSHQQADTLIVQQTPTEGLVLAAQRTESGGDAGLPHNHPLDAERVVISRVSVRQPVDETARRPEAGPTHIRLAEKGRERLLHRGEGVLLPPPSAHVLTSSSTSNKRPDIGDIHHTFEPPQEGRAPREPDCSRKAFTHEKRPPWGVRQDKARLENARRASRQPALETHVSRAPLTNNAVVRSQSVAGKQKLVQVTLWVDPAVKEHLARRAREEGLSLSPAGAAFLRKAVQQDIDLQYSALLRPIIEDAIARQMAGIATRLTWLLVRIAFDAGQTRSLVTNILGRQQGVTQPLLKTILEASGRSAKGNIMRRTPHIASLISSVEQWMTEDNRGEGDQKTHD